MDIKQREGYFSYGEVIGQYRDCEIYKTILFEGVVYEYDRLAKSLPDGRFDLAQIKAGEAFIKPGLVYKVTGCQVDLPENEMHQTIGEKTTPDVMQKAATNSQTRLSVVLGKLVGFYAFHWWRIATLRPAFGLMSDCKENLFVFGSLYWLLGLMRWATVPEKSLPNIVVNLAIGMTVIFVLTIKPKQSFHLTAAFLAASAAVDLMVLMAGFAGVTFVNEWFYVFIEVLMYMTSLRAFHHAPSEIRERGYKYQKPNL